MQVRSDVQGMEHVSPNAHTRESEMNGRPFKGLKDYKREQHRHVSKWQPGIILMSSKHCAKATHSIHTPKACVGHIHLWKAAPEAESQKPFRGQTVQMSDGLRANMEKGLEL